MRGACQCAALVFVSLLVAGCGGPAEPVWAPDAAVEAARHVHTGPASVTLYTVRSTGTGSGAHAGLMIAGSERVLFDPAGTFGHPQAPERNDVHYGITPRIEDVYVDYHARVTYDVEILQIDVSRAEADALIAAVEGYGAVPKAQCSLAVTRVLNSQQRFASVPVTWFPNTASRSFAALPGATRRLVTDDDADANHGVLIRAREELRAKGMTPAN